MSDIGSGAVQASSGTPREFLPVVLLLVASACSGWHTTSLQPRRFRAEKSPAEVRLTLKNGTELIARHPVMIGDSLVWAEWWGGGSPRDSAHSAVLASDIRDAQVYGVDAPRTVGLLLLLGGVVGGIYALLHGIAVSLGNAGN